MGAVAIGIVAVQRLSVVTRTACRGHDALATTDVTHAFQSDPDSVRYPLPVQRHLPCAERGRRQWRRQRFEWLSQQFVGIEHSDDWRIDKLASRSADGQRNDKQFDALKRPSRLTRHAQHATEHV